MHEQSGSADAPRSEFARDARADVPMRIAPLLLVGLILIVLAILGGALL